MHGVEDLDFLDEETKKKLKEEMEKIAGCKIGSGSSREDRTVDIIFYNGKGNIIKKIRGGAKDATNERCIDIPKEDKAKIYDKRYFETKEKAEDMLSYNEKYKHYPSMAVGLKKIFKSMGRVLDIGCGEGILVRSFNEIGIDAHGVDVSEEGINIGLSRAPWLEEKLHICDVDKDTLPFNNDYFDLVTIIYTIEHLCCPGKCLNEVKRVLKPRGHLLIVTHLPGRKDDITDKTHLNTRSKDEWIRLIKKHGLSEDPELERRIEQYIKKKHPSTEKGIELIKAGRYKEREELIRKMLEGRIVLLFYKEK